MFAGRVWLKNSLYVGCSQLVFVTMEAAFHRYLGLAKVHGRAKLSCNIGKFSCLCAFLHEDDHEEEDDDDDRKRIAFEQLHM